MMTFLQYLLNNVFSVSFLLTTKIQFKKWIPSFYYQFILLFLFSFLPAVQMQFLLSLLLPSFLYLFLNIKFKNLHNYLLLLVVCLPKIILLWISMFYLEIPENLVILIYNTFMMKLSVILMILLVRIAFILSLILMNLSTIVWILVVSTLHQSMIQKTLIKNIFTSLVRALSKNLVKSILVLII